MLFSKSKNLNYGGHEKRFWVLPGLETPMMLQTPVN